MLTHNHVDHLGWTGVYLCYDNQDIHRTAYLLSRKWCVDQWGPPDRKDRWYCTNAWFMFRHSSDAVLFKLSLERNP